MPFFISGQVECLLLSDFGTETIQVPSGGKSAPNYLLLKESQAISEGTPFKKDRS